MTSKRQCLSAPTFTINYPAIVVGRPTVVSYGTASLGTDDVELMVACVHAAEQDDLVHELIDVVRSACAAGPSLGGVVSIVYVTGERSWRSINVSGADYLAAEAVVTIEM